MEDEQQQPQTMEQVHAMGQAIQGLQQQLTHMQQQQQQPPSQLQRLNLKVPKFEGQSSQEYERWARAAQIVCAGNQYTLGQTLAAVLSAMTGRAADIASTLSTDPARYVNVEGFFAQLKSLFVTPAFREVARAQFQSRVQGPQEPIRVYHAMLHKLWIDAYGREEEPWRTDPNAQLPQGARREDPPGHRSRRLIESFMQGLRQYQVRIKIRDSITYGMAVQTYEEVLVRALAFLSNQERTRQEGERLQHGTTSSSRFLWDQPGPAKGGRPADAPEPMDVGGVWCRLHKTATHSNQDCRAQKGPSTTPPPLAGKGDQMRGKTKPTDVCHVCKKQGHWARDCPQRPSRPQKYVGAVEPVSRQEAEEEDWDAIYDDVPCGRGWSRPEEQGNE